MKNLFRLTLLFLLAGFLVLKAHAASDTQYERILNYSSDIQIQKDGSINVAETIDYFFPEPRHGIYRNIPYKKTNEDGKKFVMDFNKFSVTDGSGKSYNYTKSTSNGEITLKIGDANKTITG